MLNIFKVGTAMFGYMTDLNTVDIVDTREITAEGKFIGTDTLQLHVGIFLNCDGDLHMNILLGQQQS